MSDILTRITDPQHTTLPLSFEPTPPLSLERIPAGFWDRLEFIISGHLGTFPDDSIRFLWCDGFVEFEVTQDNNIRARAWIGDGPRHQEVYDATFQFSDRTRALVQSDDWKQALPAAGEGGWLTINTERRQMTVRIR